MKTKNVYLREGGYWFSKMKDGERVWVNLETNDQAEAIHRANNLRANYRTILKTHKQGGDLESAITKFIEFKADAGVKRLDRGYSPRSAEAKLYALRGFNRALPPGLSVKSVRHDHVERWFAELLTKVADTTAAGYLMAVRAFFRWTVEVAHLREDNPAKEVKGPKVLNAARTEFVNARTAEVLIESAPNDDLRFVLFSGFDAGLRKNEIIEARRDWFDLHSRVLHVRRADEPPRMREDERPFRPKHNKERTLPLTRRFAAFLRKYLVGRKPLNFALRPEVKHGDAIYRWDFRRPLDEHLESQGFAWVNPHTMRHSFTSNLASRGVPFLEIAKWLGDSVVVLERHYTHFAPDSRKIDLLHDK